MAAHPPMDRRLALMSLKNENTRDIGKPDLLVCTTDLIRTTLTTFA